MYVYIGGKTPGEELPEAGITIHQSKKKKKRKERKKIEMWFELYTLVSVFFFCVCGEFERNRKRGTAAKRERGKVAGGLIKCCRGRKMSGV